MIYEPGFLRERSKQLVLVRTWGITLITGVLTGGILVSEILKFESIGVMQCCYIALLITLAFLVFSWIWATQKELDLLFDWLDPLRYEPPNSAKEALLIIVLAALLVVLILVARNLLFFAIVFTSYSIMNIIAGRYTLREIKDAITKSKKHALKDRGQRQGDIEDKTPVYIQGIGILKKYFVSRPQMRRLYVILCFATLGSAAAVAWNWTHQEYWGIAGYGIFIFTILVSEAVIFRWRTIRDDELRQIAPKLREAEK